MSNFYKFLTVLLLFATATAFAQSYTVSGVVKSAETGENLVGANVFVKGTTIGAASDVDGKYSISVEEGDYTIVCSYIGYEKQEVEVNVTNNMELDFDLADYQFSLNVTVLADRAKERETPVAFTNVEKKAIETKLASREIPMVLNTTPSVYATQQGGGAGDARVNVRGFNQRNVAIMINGVPVNDMENGWVYWSNWDGIGDATSSIQIQRGLSAVNLATPSVGGTMNIITDPSALDFGLKAKQEFGNDAFLKTTLFAHTGLVDNKWAVSVGGVRKLGDGWADKTWSDSWAYYFGASYNLNDNNRLELYAVGAPQRHGQNLYRLNAAAYSHSFARELGFDEEVLNDPKFAEIGRKVNPNWNVVTENYDGKQYWNDGTHERYDEGFLNERENFYHKPQVNLNWYSKLSKQFSLYTTAYYSGGIGGGTGDYGDVSWDYTYQQRRYDFDKTIQINRSAADRKGKAKAAGQSTGILRNSVNRQWTVGAISKLNYKHSDNLKFALGIDARTAEIDHYREVRDLLGGTYFDVRHKSSNFLSEFWSKEEDFKKKLGDRIEYDNTNKVSWFGGYLQTEYSTPVYSLYGTFGASMNKFDYTDHFRKGPDGGELKLESDNLIGWQAKGGASYRINDQTQMFVNFGYIDRAPIFDAVIDDNTGTMNDDPKNEKITSFEGGFNFVSSDRTLSLKASYYYTTWKDRSITQNVRADNLNDALISIQGLKQLHRGLELEAAYQPFKYARLDAAASLGIWRYTDDINAKYKEVDENGNRVTSDYNLYIDGLRVGDAPQTQMVVGLTAFPVKGLECGLTYRYYRDFYAEFNPIDRVDPNDDAQSWKAPSYSLVDLNVNYQLPFNLSGLKFSVFAHVFNLFDEEYVQDAVDNSSYNAYSKNGKNHSADDAEIYMGLERTFNLGITIEY